MKVSGTLEFMHLLEKLKITKRAGWVREGASEPESISDHMYRMAMLAMLLSDSEPQLDISKCVMMALVHDLAEAEVGDITPHDGISREEKHRREATAIDRFTTELLPDNSIPSKRLRDLWNEYEVQETKEARFVKDLDRFELALQAVEYEKADKLSNLQPFFDTTVPLINHPEVKNWSNQLMDERLENSSFVNNFKDVRPTPLKD